MSRTVIRVITVVFKSNVAELCTTMQRCKRAKGNFQGLFRPSFIDLVRVELQTLEEVVEQTADVQLVVGHVVVGGGQVRAVGAEVAEFLQAPKKTIVSNV